MLLNIFSIGSSAAPVPEGKWLYEPDSATVFGLSSKINHFGWCLGFLCVNNAVSYHGLSEYSILFGCRVSLNS